MPALHGSLDAQQLLAVMNAPNMGGIPGLSPASSPSSPPGSGFVSMCLSPSSQSAQYMDLGQASPLLTSTGLVLNENVSTSTSSLLGQLSPTQQQQLLLEIKQIAEGLSTGPPSSKTSRLLLQQEFLSSSGDNAMDLQLSSPSLQGLQAQLASPIGSLSPQLQQPHHQQQQLVASPAGSLAAPETATVCAVQDSGQAAPTALVNITASELEHLMLLRSMKATLPTVQEGVSQSTDGAAAVVATISPTGYMEQQQHPQQQQLYIGMESSSSSINSTGTSFSRSYSSNLSPTNPPELHDANALSVAALSEALASVPYFAQQQQQLQLQEQQLQQQLQYQQQLIFAAPIAEEGMYTVPAQTVSLAGQGMSSLLNPLYPTQGVGVAAQGGTLLSAGTPSVSGNTLLMSNLLGQTPTMLQAAGGLASAAGGLPIANFNAAATTAAAAAAAAAGVGPWPLVAPGSTCRLFIGNLGWWVDEQLLLEYFGKCGQVVDIQVRSKGSCRPATLRWD